MCQAPTKTKSPRNQGKKTGRGDMETGGKGMEHDQILIMGCVFACGEGKNVVRGEHLGQTAVVCDYSRGDATETSDLDDVDLLVKEACVIVNVE